MNEAIAIMYEWRKMTPEERTEALERRQARRHPWHKPPHEGIGEHSYHLSAACYEHRPVIGASPRRIEEFEADLLETIQPYQIEIYAWSILPNHYHLLVRTDRMKALIAAIGKLHGRKSYAWNQEENCRGRQVWSGCIERRIRSGRHFWATLNYVHNNPVRHGYVRKWVDWPYSSAGIYLDKLGRKEAERIWKEYPLLDYGKGWDDPDL